MKTIILAIVALVLFGCSEDNVVDPNDKWNKDMANQYAFQINNERYIAGVEPLIWNDYLAQLALEHSKLMCQKGPGINDMNSIAKKMEKHFGVELLTFYNFFIETGSAHYNYEQQVELWDKVTFGDYFKLDWRTNIIGVGVFKEDKNYMPKTFLTCIIISSD